MEFALPQQSAELRSRAEDFMNQHVYPAESVLAAQSRDLTESGDRWAPRPIIDDLKKTARAAGLWNLFLPTHDGVGLSNLDYAPIAEISGRSPLLAPEAMNCSAPDTGNMEVLEMFGTPQQKSEWLQPLLDGEIRSAFGMTEPDVASSDASNIATRIERSGSEYVINGRKWWTSGAMSPRCAVFIVMGKTDPAAPRYQQQSMILVPRDTPGLKITRHIEVFGNDDSVHGGHAEIEFVDARVPAENLIGTEGGGFAISQARLGPGRIHHCMRAIGMAERALELLCARADERSTFGTALSQKGIIQDWVAQSRLRIEQARLLVYKAAWLMDTAGNKAAHTEIQAIKVGVPQTTEWVVDKAIQAHGGGGVSQDHPLADLWLAARCLRIADGPDEVHSMSLGRKELERQRVRRTARLS
ncbi:acyl-CoA dehydrogenase family protein [Rhodococcus ruber]|uniref:Acyl-CoA dehydrogenase family protein n=1 Tax=Rhodococcus ruber TaxID=1830 RepID=A0ABT4MIC3_9NOCA|nr:acyl-CoA dehydrogenase family protein [Rhodococcus ruber]MCZ4519481.1 acyl-CoA dehydrogenase family protein [Rhodococcus ruber]